MQCSIFAGRETLLCTLCPIQMLRDYDGTLRQLSCLQWLPHKVTTIWWHLFYFPFCIERLWHLLASISASSRESGIGTWRPRKDPLSRRVTPNYQLKHFWWPTFDLCFSCFLELRIRVGSIRNLLSRILTVELIICASVSDGETGLAFGSSCSSGIPHLAFTWVFLCALPGC